MSEIEKPFDDEIEEGPWRRRALLATIFTVGVLVALWVGYMISESQKQEAKAATRATKAVGAAVEAQAEKYTLAQQVAAACAGGTLDPDVQTQLCAHAREVVKEGPQGIQGIRGATGAPGAKGDTGAPGAKGDTGAPGEQGDTGADGAKGDTGADGANGTNGADGAPGEKGETGAVGPQGPAGPVGDTGPQGPPGEKGEVGATGPPGEKGEPPAEYTMLYTDGTQMRCTRDNTDDNAPTYACSQISGPAS